MIPATQSPLGEFAGTVLVVDDEEMNRILLRELLTAVGFEVLEASTGQEALDLVSARMPDTILLDVMMPGMTGFEVCRQLKTAPETSHVPVLLVTSLSDRPSRIEGIEAGANDFITKPVDTRDIPLRIRNAVKSKNLFDEIAALEETRNNLTSMIVHDMRSPLLGISGNLQLLKMDSVDVLDPDSNARVDTVLGETDKLVEMVNSMLDIGRMQARQMPLHLADHDLRDIAAESISRLGALTESATVNISSEMGESTVASCDSGLIGRVITNLVGNALKFGRGDQVRVDVSLRRTGDGRLRVCVSDNGIGISAADQEQIFELFGQASKPNGHETLSSGVGLTFCKLAIEAHGGQIAVQGCEGQGTRMSFELG